MTVTALNFREADNSITLRSSAMNVTKIGNEMWKVRLKFTQYFAYIMTVIKPTPTKLTLA